MDYNPNISVGEAVKEYSLKGHTIRRWIRAKQVQAEKVGDTYQINRDSLTKHLANTKKGAKIDAGENPVSISEVPTTSQQGSGTIAPGSGEVEGPGDTGCEAEATATPPSTATLTNGPEMTESESQPTKGPHPAPPPAETGVPAVKRGFARGQKHPRQRVESKPPNSVTKGQQFQSRAPKRKVTGRNAHRGQRKFKKGPVRYAKDVMRQLDVAQMRDVRDWLLQRLDVRSKLA